MGVVRGWDLSLVKASIFLPLPIRISSRTMIWEASLGSCAAKV